MSNCHKNPYYVCPPLQESDENIIDLQNQIKELLIQNSILIDMLNFLFNLSPQSLLFCPVENLKKLCKIKSQLKNNVKNISSSNFVEHLLNMMDRNTQKKFCFHDNPLGGNVIDPLSR